MSQKLNDIKDFVEKETSLVADVECDDNEVIFTTRENGDVGSETASQIDIDEAFDMGLKLKKIYGNKNIKCDIETVDEWVYLTVKI